MLICKRKNRSPDKLFFTAALFLLSAQLSFGQKTEIYFNTYGGVFSFHGKGATSHSTIISYPFQNPPVKFTLDPYGNTTAFSYGWGFQGQRITQKQKIYGLGIGFEELTSKVTIDKIGVSGDPVYLEYSASGVTKLKNTFFTLHPFVGHRYFYHKISFDFLAGVDFAFCLKSKETGNATSTNPGYIYVENEKAKPSLDFRPGIQIKAQKNKFGFVAGYSLGLTNYQTTNYPKADSRFLRIGLSYQLK